MTAMMVHYQEIFGWTDEEMVVFKLKYGDVLTPDEFNKELAIIAERREEQWRLGI